MRLAKLDSMLSPLSLMEDYPLTNKNGYIRLNYDSISDTSAIQFLEYFKEHSLTKSSSKLELDIHFKYDENWVFYPMASGMPKDSIRKAVLIINSSLTHEQKKAELDELLLDNKPGVKYKPVVDEKTKFEVTSKAGYRDIDVFVDGFWLGGGRGKKLEETLPIYANKVNLLLVVTNHKARKLEGKLEINGKEKKFDVQTDFFEVKANVGSYPFKDFAIKEEKYIKKKPNNGGGGQAK